MAYQPPPPGSTPTAGTGRPPALAATATATPQIASMLGFQQQLARMRQEAALAQHTQQHHHQHMSPQPPPQQYHRPPTDYARALPPHTYPHIQGSTRPQQQPVTTLTPQAARSGPAPADQSLFSSKPQNTPSSTQQDAQAEDAQTEETTQVDDTPILSASDKALPEPCRRPVVHSLVASATVGTQLNLADIARRLRHSEYKPGTLPSVVVRLLSTARTGTNGPATVLIHANGRLVVSNGVTNIDEAKLALRAVAQNLKKFGFSVSKPTQRSVHNMIATVKLGFKVNLAETYTAMQTTSTTATTVEEDVTETEQTTQVKTEEGATAEADQKEAEESVPTQWSCVYVPEVNPWLTIKYTQPMTAICHLACTGQLMVTGCREIETTKKVAAHVFRSAIRYQQAENTESNPAKRQKIN
eukprot:TRINITY_DN66548_c3_g3_i1.p1 TRINITY_DN66548_c3_g3~~TRINITY_DN66548_c3_g3_i1.p1  ORF type:complete len:414 (-),score=53.27 TRINITY_DN66548_c3_g3_i1:1207-2448(-)